MSSSEQRVGGALKFPADFQFGVATASHQVEGGNDKNDWWAFEQKPGRIKDGTQSGAACEHYQRYRGDIQLIKDLSLTAYRFSIEWARIEPEPGRFDIQALNHYAEMADACRQAGIEPVVTLYHFTLPNWFAERGGFLMQDSPAIFGRYVREVSGALGDRVSLWMTLNEPIVYLYHGYLAGIWPPEKKNPKEMAIAGRNLIRAHFEALRILRSGRSYQNAGAKTGLATHFRVFDPARENNRADKTVARVQDAIFNWAFLESIHTGRCLPPYGIGEPIGVLWEGSGHDFLGINYYTRGRVRFDPKKPGGLFGAQETTPGALVNDLGWEIYPEGLSRAVRAVYNRYGLPVWISENGIADASDSLRPAYLVHHLAEVARLIEEGIPVKGYYHWSLTDNFEWAEGFSARFGLYAMNYETQERMLRKSGELYGRIASDFEIFDGALERYPLKAV